MTRIRTFIVLALLIPAPVLAQSAQPQVPSSRLWIVAGGAWVTLRGHCQDCGQEFPFRHGGAVAQFRPWSTQGFFIKGGAGMALVRNWVATTGPNPDDSKALSVVIGAGWEFNPNGRLGLQLFGMQHVGALGDLQTAGGQVNDVTANFWSLGAAIVIR